MSSNDCSFDDRSVCVCESFAGYKGTVIGDMATWLRLGSDRAIMARRAVYGVSPPPSRSSIEWGLDSCRLALQNNP